jgi:hypothetical protein
METAISPTGCQSLIAAAHACRGRETANLPPATSSRCACVPVPACPVPACSDRRSSETRRRWVPGQTSILESLFGKHIDEDRAFIGPRASALFESFRMMNRGHTATTKMTTLWLPANVFGLRTIITSVLR